MQVSVDDVRSAAKRIRPAAIVTPLLPAFDISNSSRLFLKPESLQSTGSFKIRGAYNTASLLREEERSRGLITYSSGNHAQALAYTAKLLGVSCTVVMPDDAKTDKDSKYESTGSKKFFWLLLANVAKSPRKWQETREKLWSHPMIIPM